jgi:hypothetical protein
MRCEDAHVFTGPYFAKELITAEYCEKILTILGYSGCLNLGRMIALRASDHMLDILHMVLALWPTTAQVAEENLGSHTHAHRLVLLLKYLFDRVLPAYDAELAIDLIGSVPASVTRPSWNIRSAASASVGTVILRLF